MMFSEVDFLTFYNFKLSWFKVLSVSFAAVRCMVPMPVAKLSLGSEQVMCIILLESCSILSVFSHAVFFLILPSSVV